MRKILYTLAIIMAIAFAGMQSINAQIYVNVGWTIQCPDTCTSHQTCIYMVEYAIIDQCSQPAKVICSDTAWVNCSSFGSTFICSYDCEDETHNPCYLAVGRATKFCNGPGGSIAICQGEDQKNYTCIQLLTFGADLNIEW